MLTPAQQTEQNQGSIIAANNANAANGIVPNAAAGQGVFINPPAPAGTLTATFPQPASKTVSPPAVVTSDAANTHIGQMQTSTDQANADLANHLTVSTSSPTAGGMTPAGTAITPASDTSTDSDATSTDYDAQINDILNSLTNGSTTAQPNSLESTTTDDDNAQIAQDQQDQQTVANSINSINNGTYPLSTNEKAQVANVASTYAGALTDAQKYAAAIAGGATVAGATSGLQEYSPSINLGNIQNAINTGQAKIATINSQILDAQGKLTTALLNGDYKSATDLYKQIGDNITARTKEITDIQTALDKETTQMQDNAKLALSTAISEQKMDATTAQNTINNAYKSGMLSIAEQKEMTALNKTTQVNSLATDPAMTVPLTGTGEPDATKQQAFLQALPGGETGSEASFIKGLANYTIAPTAAAQKLYAGSTGLTQQDAIALAQQYDPTYDSSQYSTRQAMQKNITSGAYNTTIVAANTLVNHLNDLNSALKALYDPTKGGLNNGGFLGSLGNSAKIGEANLSGGNQYVKQFQTISQAVAEEAAKIYKGTASPSEGEIDQWLSTLSPTNSEATNQASINAILSLMGGKLSEIGTNYQNVMDKPLSSGILLSPQSATLLENMGLNPSDYDPNFNNSSYNGVALPGSGSTDITSSGSYNGITLPN